jgi:integrase
MARPPSVQITRNPRADASVTFALRARVGGADETVPLGNTAEGWDEARAERARRQLLAKIDLGLWIPGSPRSSPDEEPTFAELATGWLIDRERNPGIRERTTENDRWRLTRYLIPFFGKLRPSQMTPVTIKHYRRHIHEENEHIRAAAEAGAPLRDGTSGLPLRTLSNDSINKTLLTLSAILDEAEDAGWIARNVARGRRTREPIKRRSGDALTADELNVLLEAAIELDRRHKPETLSRARRVRHLRDDAGLRWSEIASRLGIATSTAMYLHTCVESDDASTGPRTAVIATLAFSGLRVSELCALDLQDIDLAPRRIQVRDSKTPAGIRTVDIRPRLLELLSAYPPLAEGTPSQAPAFPTRPGRRRDRNNVRSRVITPVLKHANVLRAERGQPPILTRVTPHTFRRTYTTVMLAAGFDLPYVQDQVGHADPTTTLAVYAKVIRRPDRDAMRTEMRALLGEDRSETDQVPGAAQRRELDVRGTER